MVSNVGENVKKIKKNDIYKVINYILIVMFLIMSLAMFLSSFATIVSNNNFVSHTTDTGIKLSENRYNIYNIFKYLIRYDNYIDKSPSYSYLYDLSYLPAYIIILLTILVNIFIQSGCLVYSIKKIIDSFKECKVSIGLINSLIISFSVFFITCMIISIFSIGTNQTLSLENHNVIIKEDMLIAPGIMCLLIICFIVILIGKFQQLIKKEINVAGIINVILNYIILGFIMATIVFISLYQLKYTSITDNNTKEVYLSSGTFGYYLFNYLYNYRYLEGIFLGGQASAIVLSFITLFVIIAILVYGMFEVMIKLLRINVEESDQSEIVFPGILFILSIVNLVMTIFYKLKINKCIEYNDYSFTKAPYIAIIVSLIGVFIVIIKILLNKFILENLEDDE